MPDLIRPIVFDPQGEKLWINVDMFGIYFITYTYQLWSSDASTPPVLTNPVKSGSNEVPHDDFYPVVNDYHPSEHVSKNEGRVIDVGFWITKGDDDNGYTLRVTVLQGNNYETATPIGSHEVSGKNDGQTTKKEFVPVKLTI